MCYKNVSVDFTYVHFSESTRKTVLEIISHSQRTCMIKKIFEQFGNNRAFSIQKIIYMIQM